MLSSRVNPNRAFHEVKCSITVEGRVERREGGKEGGRERGRKRGREGGREEGEVNFEYLSIWTSSVCLQAELICQLLT